MTATFARRIAGCKRQAKSKAWRRATEAVNRGAASPWLVDCLPPARNRLVQTKVNPWRRWKWKRVDEGIAGCRWLPIVTLRGKGVAGRQGWRAGFAGVAVARRLASYCTSLASAGWPVLMSCWRSTEKRQDSSEARAPLLIKGESQCSRG
ncbi:uncharacterized protein BKA78DRAFT_311242 [Phyllosticta capitalensis]|uniref:uncharacterized protein n=1 Tax=Phyllosticta capitalensis TaxID=121624 RepID=UPI00312F461A